MRLLTDDRGIDTIVEDFSAQWLNLRRLEEVNINTVLFPEYDVSLIEAFEKETKLFIASTLREDTSILELIGADYTFVNERLARHYGIDNVNGSRFRRTRIPDTEKRGGLLAQGALLTVTSYPGRTSPVLRGKWLLDNMLGTPPPPPPPNVPILAEASSGDAPSSIRERLAQHRSDPFVLPAIMSLTHWALRLRTSMSLVLGENLMRLGIQLIQTVAILEGLNSMDFQTCETGCWIDLSNSLTR